jgi:hypothetical protein
MEGRYYAPQAGARTSALLRALKTRPRLGGAPPQRSFALILWYNPFRNQPLGRLRSPRLDAPLHAKRDPQAEGGIAAKPSLCDNPQPGREGSGRHGQGVRFPHVSEEGAAGPAVEGLPVRPPRQEPDAGRTDDPPPCVTPPDDPPPCDPPPDDPRYPESLALPVRGRYPRPEGACCPALLDFEPPRGDALPGHFGGSGRLGYPERGRKAGRAAHPGGCRGGPADAGSRPGAGIRLETRGRRAGHARVPALRQAGGGGRPVWRVRCRVQAPERDEASSTVPVVCGSPGRLRGLYCGRGRGDGGPGAGLTRQGRVTPGAGSLSRGLVRVGPRELFVAG